MVKILLDYHVCLHKKLFHFEIQNVIKFMCTQDQFSHAGSHLQQCEQVLQYLVYINPALCAASMHVLHACRGSVSGTVEIFHYTMCQTVQKPEHEI